MKTRNLWVAIALVFLAQIATAQKVEKVDVQISAYQVFETKMMGALEKYRSDRLELGLAPEVAKRSIIESLQTSIVDAFMSDKDKTVKTIMSKPVTVLTTPNFICEPSKNYQKIQDAYKCELTNFWNMYAKFGKGGPAVTTTSSTNPVVVRTDGDIVITQKVFTDHTEIITTIKNSGIGTQSTPSASDEITLRVPNHLSSYVLALVKVVTHEAEVMANAWQSY